MTMEKMEKIKVLLANRPRMMRELVREIIECQPDMEIVGEVLDPVSLLLAARETEADVVIIALMNTEDSGLVSHLLAQCPHVTILGLASTGDTALGDTAFIEQLCPWRREITELSAVNVLRVLRHAVREPCSLDSEVP